MEKDPFEPGWLEEQLTKIVKDLSQRPEHLKPALTGERARTRSEALRKQD